MTTFRESLRMVENQRKRLEVHADDEERIRELRRQFAVHNVDIEQRLPTTLADPGFVVVRDDESSFLGAVGLDHLDDILSPEIHPPWHIDETDADLSDLFDFLENTLFSSYSRRQLLATSREIESRAWRVGHGRLYAGFQRSDALETQANVYERLGADRSLSVTAFVPEEPTEPLEGVRIITDDSETIERYWFAVFDGGGTDLQKCALIAEERDPDTYVGFWTYDPAFVDDLLEHLEAMTPRQAD